MTRYAHTSNTNKHAGYEELSEACAIKSEQEACTSTHEALVVKTRHEARKDTRVAHVLKQELKALVTPCVAHSSDVVPKACI